MILLRALAACLAAAARFRSHLFWRAFYRVLRSRAVIAVAAAAVGVAERVGGPGRRDFVLSRFSERFVTSGWPAQHPGWVNLDLSRFVAHVRTRRRRAAPREKREPRSLDGAARIGCLGRFSLLLGFGRPLFEASPDDVEVHVFDLPADGRHAPFLEELATSYLGLPDGCSVSELARAINAARLDALLVVVRGREAYELLDVLETPCVMYVCTGSDLLHHERVDVQLYVQPQADYFLRGDRLFCGTSRAWFSRGSLASGFLAYDPRGLDATARRPWGERDPLIVVHGSLYKAASPQFLGVLLALLREDSELELVVEGKDNGNARAQIAEMARAEDVEGRVHFEEAFSPARGADGAIEDPRWAGLAGLLGRARLAPDPFPICGGTSRVEAFGAGAPSPHLGVSYDKAIWGRRQEAVVEVAALSVQIATAHSVAEYGALCRSCLYDADLAERVASAQADVFERVTDGAAYWRQVVRCYEEWRRESGRGEWQPAHTRTTLRKGE
jgi:hypothetical protein